MKHLRHLLVFACITACDGSAASDHGDESDGSSAGGLGFDESDVVERAMAYASELELVNAMPRASQHGLAAKVDVWVARDIAELYRSLDPAATDERVEFPDGALLVKEHLDDAGAFAGLTVMAKGDPASMSDGWWWGRIDADGALRDGGEVGYCVACHAAVESEGWAFGVALDNRR